MDTTPRPSTHADVVIIGGGIVGTATAWWLSQRGMAVVLLEKDRIAGRQSGKAWGFVRQLGRDPDELPLAARANRLWPTLTPALGADLEWCRGGCLYLAHSQAQMARYEHWRGQAGHLDCRLLGAAEVARLVPTLAVPPIGGLFAPEDGHADPLKTTRALAAAARANGAILHEGCGALGIDTAAGRIAAVVSEAGTIACKTVVLAAGATSHRLLAGLGIFLPQQTVRATVARTAPLPPLTRAAFLGHGLGLRQHPDGRVTIADDRGSDIDLTLDRLRGWRWFLPGLARHFTHFSFKLGRPFLDDLRDRLPGAPPPTIGRRPDPARPNPVRIARAMRRLQTLFPDARHPIVTESWAGDIDTTPDALPVIDAPGTPAGLVVATGFSGHGFALGPAVGQLLADWIAGSDPGDERAPFGLDRFTQGRLKAPADLAA